MTTANTTSAREGSMSHVTVFVAVAKPGSTRIHLAALGAWKSGDQVSLCTAARVGLELDVPATDARRVRYARGANCTKCLERSKSIQRSEFRYRDEETQAMATDEARARWAAESRAYSAAKDAADKDLERFLDLAESLDATPRQDARAEDERSRDEWVAMAKATMSPVPELTDEPADAARTPQPDLETYPYNLSADEFNQVRQARALATAIGPISLSPAQPDMTNEPELEDDYATPEHPSVFRRETFPRAPEWLPEPDETQAAVETFYRAEAMPASREPYATDELGAPFIPGRSRVEHESDRGNYGLCTRSEQAGVWVTWDDTPGDRDWQYAAGELRLVKRF